MYCDICEKFDLHETEDCPTQAMEEEEEQTHTHTHAKRHVERPYCDNCEGKLIYAFCKIIEV